MGATTGPNRNLRKREEKRHALCTWEQASAPQSAGVSVSGWRRKEPSCVVPVMEAQVSHMQELASQVRDIFITGGITFRVGHARLHMFSTGLCTQCKLRDAYSRSPYATYA